jgi:hypothetical protein
MRLLTRSAVFWGVLLVAGRAAADVTEIAVSFDVVNTNRSALPCPSDGKPYVVTGHLVGPSSAFTSSTDAGRVVTVLLTGQDEGEWAWRFKDVPGYDYAAEMAKLGHVSLSLDMLGYGQSGHPQGQLLCYGSHADVLHQIIEQLRRPSYRVLEDGAQPVAFSTVLVSGHDTGPWPAIINAYTWPGDIDGLSTQIVAHQGFTPYIIDIFARRNAACALGGQNHDDPRDDPDDLMDDPSRGGGYIFFGPPDEQFRSDLFHEERTDPAVIDAVIGLRNRNACGQLFSTATAIRMDLSRMSEIQFPVLLVFPGPDDPVISREGQEQEAANYSGSDDVTTAWLDSGHFMELEHCAPEFRALTAHWIHQRWGVGNDVALPTIGSSECVTEVRVKAP